MAEKAAHGGARPGAGRPKSTVRDDASVKVDRAIVGKAKLIVAHRGGTLAELLSESLRAPIDKAYGQMLSELNAGE